LILNKRRGVLQKRRGRGLASLAGHVAQRGWQVNGGPSAARGAPVYDGPSQARGRRGGGAATATPWPALRQLAVAALRGTGRRAEGTGGLRAVQRGRCTWRQRLGVAGVHCSRGGGDGLRRA